MECRSRRLLIRDFVEADRGAVRLWREDADVTRYLDKQAGTSPDAWFDAVLRYNAQVPRTSHDAAIVLRSTGVVIGWIGIARSFDPSAGELTVGYALDKSAWGHDYMTEALVAVLSYGFAKLGVRSMSAQCYTANGASARVMEKAGMKFAGPALSADPSLGHSVRYVAERDTWRRPGRRRLGLAVAIALLALVGFPLGADPVLRALNPPEPPTDARLVRWVPRGDLSGDREFIAQATRVWRESTGQTMPGALSKVYAVWAGRIGAGRVALLQGVGKDGHAYVAQVSDRGRPPVLRLDRQEKLGRPPPKALVINYSGDLSGAGSDAAVLRLVLAPTDFTSGAPGEEAGTAGAEAAGATGTVSNSRLQMWRRLGDRPLGRDSEWSKLRPDRDGLSVSWLHDDRRSPYGSIVVFSRPRTEGAGRLDTVAASPTHLVVGQPPVQLEEPTWGPARKLDLAAFDDGRAVLAESAAMTVARGLDISLLAEARDRTGRMVVLELRGRQGHKIAVVAWRGRRLECVAAMDVPRLQRRRAVALGCVNPRAGLLVLAAVAGPGATQVDLLDARRRLVLPVEGHSGRLVRLPVGAEPLPLSSTVVSSTGGREREPVDVIPTMTPGP
ncbi:Protein N-acetyltransferase, RimJ/RimL family [Actinopolymorpha cephalotaxi]|uniref:Protein N-acetyltransferase, RimJ/RimL family n=1 Tax=Actinopolymorpha cephalotaxi TaxID=504797 RepID=A0A1I2W3G3_9ACTN|nr:GNAT family N-acetyltransferase [Actinopolymorpha cephalotaxi]NYH82774.1 RimJ/RimL family protein N-acetyltransferase [Actinopolymorpha cephalotaxi]SFG95893.1 Protein N-acetyltransferase, RimJ/RimL family [Actinopolymorpha cephalotaxi]